MHNNSNMRNKQMEVNICKILPLFKISRTHAWKWPLFLDFAPFIEKKKKKKKQVQGRDIVFFLIVSLVNFRKIFTLRNVCFFRLILDIACLKYADGFA